MAAGAALVLAAAAGAGWLGLADAAPTISAHIAAAVANPARPADDVARDAARKPAEVLAFAGVRPGQTVLELIPSKGYFTRLLSGAVGSNGHVTEAVPNLTGAGDVRATSNGVAADPHFANVSEIAMSADALSKVGPVDLVWTSQNYHDLHRPKLNLDVVALDREIFKALKPGGVFFIEDHAAAAGSGIRDVDTLHRIDAAFVKQEVESVGFKLDGESDVLRNPADDHTLKVFDPAIRGHTDQFLLRFRKPR
jgi:predicted methyltransferase